MPTWLMPLIMALLDPEGPIHTIEDVILIGRANGMSEEEAQSITDFYTEAKARRKADAGIVDG